MVVQCTGCGVLYKRLLASGRAIADYYDEQYAASEYWDRDAAVAASAMRTLSVLARIVPHSSRRAIEGDREGHGRSGVAERGKGRITDRALEGVGAEPEQRGFWNNQQ